jgi:sulfur carrier protein
MNAADQLDPSHEAEVFPAAQSGAVITIRLDGKPSNIAAGTSLGEVVAAAGHAPESVATALNGSFVSRHQRDAIVLQADDDVLLFQPIVGG